MRKLIAILILALFTSCAHAPKGGEFRRARDSAYKMEVTLKLDLTPLKEWRAKKAAEAQAKEDEKAKKEREEFCAAHLCAGHPSGIHFADSLYVQPTLAQETTDLHFGKITDDTTEIGWSGTGWVIGRGDGGSYIMTAGHVCESKDVYPFDMMNIDWENFTVEMVHFDFPIIEKHHVMVGRDGVKSGDATLIRDEDLDDDFNGNDLCMLGVGSRLGTPVQVALHDPEYGESCSVVGAPTGLWGGGIAVPSDATFAGRGSVFGTEPDGLAFNGLLAPGNSGSAVICDDEVVGVISLGSTRFRSLIHAVPHDRVREFVRKALHKGK